MLSFPNKKHVKLEKITQVKMKDFFSCQLFTLCSTFILLDEIPKDEF